MHRRATPWLLALPLVATSVLIGHALAYRLTGEPLGEAHAYLAHAPQVLLIAGLFAVLGFAVDARSRRPLHAPLVGAGLLVFAVQEHAEHYAHTGHLPLLVGDRAFLVGLALQIPIGLVCVAVARWLLDAVDVAAALRPRPAGISVLPITWTPAPRRPAPGRASAFRRGRSPPLPVRP